MSDLKKRNAPIENTDYSMFGIKSEEHLLGLDYESIDCITERIYHGGRIAWHSLRLMKEFDTRASLMENYMVVK